MKMSYYDLNHEQSLTS